ncbi:hypothetical protein, partial [Staphylococcus aureus]|uniref:hypothetical protein n=1 Tax=Staphylococcus aureus TaxID=1280 RepID=UPI0038B252ED
MIEFLYFGDLSCFVQVCKRLSPQLDATAPILASLKHPIVIAKVISLSRLSGVGCGAEEFSQSSFCP